MQTVMVWLLRAAKYAASHPDDVKAIMQAIAVVKSLKKS
jgi:hypothetical protein